ncbi:MAG: efflux RND transporter permease subunit, partial [Dokdonella sp.]
TVDRVQAQSMGVSLSDVYTAIQLMLAPIYVDDFFHQGRVQRVIMQADSAFRMSPDAISHYYLPSTLATGVTGTGAADRSMIPLSNVVRTEWVMGSPSLTRYNGYAAIQMNGGPAPGRSSGEAMQAMTDIIGSKDFPQGFSSQWSGQSLQEIVSGNQAPLLFGLSILAVFLCLAALYESWSIPFAVMLVVPVGITGALVATLLRHQFDENLNNDIFFKIGLITIIGLAAKNAILIVEFAVQEQKAGRNLATAVVDAARLRLRPILMTSFCFILGVLPLAISSGAGANARHAIGTGVIGGMIFATFLGVLFIPIFYVIVRRLLGDKMESPEATLAATSTANEHR